jgi:hypothetical protein
MLCSCKLLHLLLPWLYLAAQLILLQALQDQQRTILTSSSYCSSKCMHCCRIDQAMLM